MQSLGVPYRDVFTLTIKTIEFGPISSNLLIMDYRNVSELIAAQFGYGCSLFTPISGLYPAD